MLKLFKIFLTTLLLSSLNAHAELLSARVVGVSDGDTITVLDNNNSQYKVRLSGIDAPEKKQPFGQASKQSLSELVYDKQVIVDWHKNDRYGRIVGKVLLNRADINLMQVKRGLAWHYTKYQKEQPSEDRLIYLNALKDAQKAKQGLWTEPNPIAPWDWRKINK